MYLYETIKEGNNKQNFNFEIRAGGLRINVNKLGGENDVAAKGADYNDALFDYHTHQDWGSTLADGEGFSTYASGKEESDEYARSL